MAQKRGDVSLKPKTTKKKGGNKVDKKEKTKQIQPKIGSSFLRNGADSSILSMYL